MSGSLLLVLHGLIDHATGLADLGRLDRLLDEVVGALAELLLLVEAPSALVGDADLGFLGLVGLLVLCGVRLRLLVADDIG